MRSPCSSQSGHNRVAGTARQGDRDRIAGRSGAAAGERPNEQVIAEVDELRQRVAELEERQDFTERVLARQREQSQLDSGV